MADDVTPASQPAPSAPPTPAKAPTEAPAPAEGEASGKGKAKKAIDPDKRERDAAEAQLRRELKALAKDKDAAKLRAAAAKVKELRGEASAPSSSTAEAPKAPEAELSKLEPGQLPGWPKPSEVAEQEGLVAHLWGEARRALPARYARVLEVRTETGTVVNAEGKSETVEITINPVVTLTKGTAPLAAQLLGKVNAMTPTAAALVAVGTVFGPALFEHLGELLFSPSEQPALVGEKATAPEAKA